MEGESLDAYWDINHAELLMREFESKSMYLEAENQRQFIQKLKRDVLVPVTDQQFHNSWKQALRNVLGSNRERWKHFELIWASRLRDHDFKANELVQSIHQKHRNRIHDLAQISEQGVRYPKWSNKLLKLRKRQYLLGKTQRYLEGYRVKIQADAMESAERLAILDSIEKSVRMKTLQLEKKHQKELQICKDKMDLERRCLLEGKKQLSETLRCQCDRAVVQIKHRARLAAAHRKSLMKRTDPDRSPLGR